MSQKNEKNIPASAEELNDYVHITRPSVWLILLAVGTFVAGLVIWSLTANLVTAVPAAAISDETGQHLYVDTDYAKEIKTGDTVIVNGTEYKVQSVSESSVTAAEILSDYERSIISVMLNDSITECKMDGTLPEGVYNAMIVVGMERPISFLFRSKGK